MKTWYNFDGAMLTPRVADTVLILFTGSRKSGFKKPDPDPKFKNTNIFPVTLFQTFDSVETFSPENFHSTIQ